MASNNQGQIDSDLKYAKHLDINADQGISLRLSATSDVAELHGILAANREHLEEFQHLEIGDITIETVEQSVNKMLKNMSNGSRLQYRIVTNNAIAGSVTLYDRTAKTAKMGYWVSKDYKGKGYAATAAHRLAEYSFNELGLESILLEIDPRNVRSERVAELLGAHVTSTVGTEEVNGRTLNFRTWEIVP